MSLKQLGPLACYLTREPRNQWPEQTQGLIFGTAKFPPLQASLLTPPSGCPRGHRSTRVSLSY